MPTLQEQLTDLKDIVDEFAPDLASTLAGLNAAKDTANAAANSVQAQYDASSESQGSLYRLYVDAVNGDDANNGQSLAAPIKTWARMCALLKASRWNSVYLFSDISADTVGFLRNAPGKIDFIGRNAANTDLERRKITFVDAASPNNYPGGFFFYASSGCEITAIEVDFELAHTTARSPVEVPGGMFYVQIESSVITRTGTGSGHLFGGRFAAHFEVVNVTIDPSASGYIIEGVPAAGDPNAKPGVSANFTSS